MLLFSMHFDTVESMPTFYKSILSDVTLQKDPLPSRCRQYGYGDGDTAVSTLQVQRVFPVVLATHSVQRGAAGGTV